jgi:serine-type D-Ala-D-Ala carboxypeptidase (penicillin-binding protein 5/6)
MKYSGLVSEVNNIRISVLLLLFLAAGHWSLVTAVAAEEIHSGAAVVIDAATGSVLFAKNPDLRLMPASTTKLMTALVVMERANLTDVVTVSRKVASSPATKIGLKEGDVITIEALLYSALIKSANDAAIALAEGVAGSEEEFVDLMNRKAIALGLNNTRFINPNGLPGPGQYITAHDLAEIMREAIKYPLLKQILGTRVAEVSTEEGRKMVVKNTNHLLWSDAEVLGGKTGYTRQARHCFVSAGTGESGTLIVALLGNPIRNLLWKETEDLMALGKRVMNNLEEPVVYITKLEYDASKLTRASYTKKSRGKKTRKKKRILVS